MGATSVMPQSKVYTNILLILLKIIIKVNLINGKSGLIYYRPWSKIKAREVKNKPIIPVKDS